MTTLFAIALIVVLGWTTGGVPWWSIVLGVFLVMMDLGASVQRSKMRKPYVSFDDAPESVSPLHWMADGLIDLTADIRRVLNEIEDDIAS